MPLAVSCASLEFKTALHIEHWANAISADNIKKINKTDKYLYIIRRNHYINPELYKIHNLYRQFFVHIHQ